MSVLPKFCLAFALLGAGLAGSGFPNAVSAGTDEGLNTNGQLGHGMTMKRGVPVGVLTGASGEGTPVLAQEGPCDIQREPGELAILGETTPPVNQGSVQIPELNVSSEISNGCFAFRHLRLPEDPMLISFQVTSSGYRPTTWANWLLVSSGSAPTFTPELEVGDDPQTFDLCAEILVIPSGERSAAQAEHLRFCPASLPHAGAVARDPDPLRLRAIYSLLVMGAFFLGAGVLSRWWLCRRPAGS
jgi:hypothetical protein